MVAWNSRSPARGTNSFWKVSLSCHLDLVFQLPGCHTLPPPPLSVLRTVRIVNRRSREMQRPRGVNRQLVTSRHSAGSSGAWLDRFQLMKLRLAAEPRSILRPAPSSSSCSLPCRRICLNVDGSSPATDVCPSPGNVNRLVYFNFIADDIPVEK